MKAGLISVVSLLAATATAQSAPQFEVVVEENLPVTYGASNTEVTPGVLLPRNDTLEAPTVSLPQGAPENQTYIVFMIDQDVPRNGTTFTLLHWFLPDLHRSMNGSSLAVMMIDDSTAMVGAEYVPPTPPGGSGPHRYTFLLYEQPDNFTVPEAFADINPPAETTDRIGFNMTAFVAAANLGQPVAANYLRVLNGTEAETSSAEAATGTIGVAPTESPTIVASTTDEDAAASATSAQGDVTETSTAVATASPTAGGGSGSGTADSSSPASTSTEGSGAAAAFGSGRNSMVGLALAVVGAGMFMA